MLLEFQCPTPQVTNYPGFFSSPSLSLSAVAKRLFSCVAVQLCVEACPSRHLTLVKAKVGSKEDQDYYKQYCKEGVNFAKLVSIHRP